MGTNPDLFKAAAGQLVPAVETIGSFKENAILMGIAGGSVGDSVYRSASASKYSDVASKAAKEDKAKRDLQRFIDLLDQMRAELDRLDAHLEDLYRDLREKYGSDVVQGLGEAFLTPEERAGKSSEEIKKALIEKYLDEDGNLKPEYSGLDPQVLDAIQTWKKQMPLEAVIKAADEEHTRTGAHSPETLQSIEDVAQAQGLTGSLAMEDSAENNDTGEQVVSVDTDHQSDVRGSNSVGFNPSDMSS